MNSNVTQFASEYDVVVIGAGLAGLSAAAHLAKAGKKVAVIEQHSRPGGYYTSFTRNGIIFDITAHWTIDHEKVNRMLTELHASPIEFIHHQNIGKYIGPGTSRGILLVDSRERFEQSILEAYPSANKKSIDKLVEISLKVEEELRGFSPASPELMSLPSKVLMMASVPFKLRAMMKYGRMPGEKFLEYLFPGDDLKGLRAALFMLAPIKNMTALGMLLYIGFALRGRAYLPEGGAYVAGEAFAKAATLNGAEVHYGTRVKSIRLDGRKVAGVTLENGRMIDAKYVVSAMDARQTYFKLIDPSLVPADFRKRLENTPLSDTFFIASIVTDLDPSTYGLDQTDVFITDTADINAGLTPDDPEHSFYSIQFPEFHDKTLQPGLHGIQLVAPASFEYKDHWGTGPGYIRTEDYEKIKAEFAKKLIARAEKIIPGLSGHIVSMDLATPLTFYRYTLNDRGSPVGWSYTSMQQWKQKVPFIDGLYMAGQWVGPSGIYNVSNSGRNAAELILKDR